MSLLEQVQQAKTELNNAERRQTIACIHSTWPKWFGEELYRIESALLAPVPRFATQDETRIAFNIFDSAPFPLDPFFKLLCSISRAFNRLVRIEKLRAEIDLEKTRASIDERAELERIAAALKGGDETLKLSAPSSTRTWTSRAMKELGKEFNLLRRVERPQRIKE